MLTTFATVAILTARQHNTKNGNARTMDDITKQLPSVVPLEEVCRLLRCDKWAVYRLKNKGVLTPIPSLRPMRFRRTEVEALVNGK